MTPDLQKEFQSLSSQARQELKNAAASGSYRTVFTFWRWPSFTPSLRCTVYAPSRPEEKLQQFAEFKIWRSDLDIEKLKSPVERLKYPKDLIPTFEDAIVRLTDQQVIDIEQRLQGVSIPIFFSLPTVVGTDGTGYEFHYGRYFFGATLCWWEDRPKEWTGFTQLVVQIVKELENKR